MQTLTGYDPLCLNKNFHTGFKGTFWLICSLQYEYSFLCLAMEGRGCQPLWMPLGLSNYKMSVACYVGGGAELLREEFVFCVRTRTEKGVEKKNQRITRNLWRNAELLLWRDILHSGNFSPWGRQTACMEKNKTIPPPSLLPVCLSPLTLLTCIAGLVGVKIDWQSLNWKWSLNAGYSCWGFEFSLTLASRAASRWGKLVRAIRSEHWGLEPRIMDGLC